MTTLTGR